MEPQGCAIAPAAAGGLRGAPSAAAAAADLNSPADTTGQMQIWMHATACYSVNARLINASLTCACGCAGAEAMRINARQRHGPPPANCTVCGRQIQAKQPSRPCGAGRAHVTCIIRQNRHAVATHTPVARAKRSYDTLQSTQKWKRRKQLHSTVVEASQQIRCPVETLHLQQRTTPEELLHLSTAERERIRTVPSLHIPCEQSMIQCKQLLATSHATETGTFVGGAYITD